MYKFPLFERGCVCVCGGGGIKANDNNKGKIETESSVITIWKIHVYISVEPFNTCRLLTHPFK